MTPRTDLLTANKADPTPAMNFRNDINGLRAIAVTAVVMYHFGVAGFPGGFAGVDVFFVISGFLMTGIVFGKLERGQFSLTGFYLDRARRIIPALAALCACLLALGWFLLPASQYAALGKHAAGAISFISNHVFRDEAAYFAAGAHEKWLLHTWSLSVEWQFYMLYPIAVLLLSRVMPLSRVRWFIVAAAVASFALSVVASVRWPGSAFFFLPTRAWELLAGGIVCLFPLAWTRRTAAGAELLGLAMIVGSVILLSEASTWPGWLAAIPVAGAGLVVAAARSDSAVTGNPAAQFLGKISYSVYLWHWPVVVGLHYFDKSREVPWIVGGIAASVVLGHASFLLVESRFRAGKAGRRASTGLAQGRLVWGQVAMVSVVLAAGLALVRSDGIPGAARAINSDERALFLASYENLLRNGLHEDYRHECDFHDWKTKSARTAIDASCTRLGKRPAVFVWGDSHAQALTKGLRQLYPGEVAQVATSACPPSLQAHGSQGLDNNCDLSNRYALAEIAHLKPATVVLAQVAHHETTDWDAIAGRLRGLGVHEVVLVGPMPNWRPSLPVIVARRHWHERLTYLGDGLDPKPIATDKLLAARYGGSNRLHYVSLIQSLCSPAGCVATLPQEQGLIVVDYGHLSPSGSVFVADRVLAMPLKTVVRLAAQAPGPSG